MHTWTLHSLALPEPDVRSVLVYLPPQYELEPDRRFPVFYLHDGQNLFESAHVVYRGPAPGAPTPPPIG